MTIHQLRNSPLNSEKSSPRSAGAGLDSGGDGPHDGNMEHRVTVLETRLDATLPNLASKSDLEGLRTEMHKGFSDMVKWIVGTAIVLGVAAITIMTFVLNNATPKAPYAAAPSPIIISVPQAAPAPPPVAQQPRP